MPKTLITPEIAAYIKDNYLKQSGASIAKKFGIKRNIIYHFEKKEKLIIPKELKLKFRIDELKKRQTGKSSFTVKEDEFIKENYLNLPVKTIANMIGRSGCGVIGALKRLNLVIPQSLADERKKAGMYRKG